MTPPTARPIEGRVALVTGGRGGAGRAVCARLEREGAHVYAADVSEHGTMGDVPAAGEFLKRDRHVSDVEACARYVARVAGRVDHQLR